LALTAVSVPPPGQAAASAPLQALLLVDPSRPGPEISPYLYGQFIEHLGRCIHDGVWAEKLRDRKFLLALDKSPWQETRAEDARFEAFLDTGAAYCGEHGLVLWRRDTNSAPCGVVQKDIGLVAGKEYVGYAVLAVRSGNPTVEAKLVWGSDSSRQQTVCLTGLDSTYRRVAFRFRAGRTTDSAAFSLEVTKQGTVWVGCVSLMPADNVKGMRRDVLALIKKLNPPITRWPGGNFVSGYNWKDGIGERDRRPPRWERAWNDVEDNDFGLDEFMTFCAEVGTEPYIAVNAGLGSAEDAADEVEYATGSKRTRWGAQRALNGHPGPYKITWWGIGNEMYGDWQLGQVRVERYALRHNAFVEAMKARNPHIKIVGVGAPGRWNNGILPISATEMDLLSGHHYVERRFNVPFSPEDARQYERNLPDYSSSLLEGIKRIVDDFRHRKSPGNPAVDQLHLAVDEWGIVRDWNARPDGPGVGSFEHYYPLGDGLVAARGLHELLRSADVVRMANWAQTVNVLGAIKTSRNYAVLGSVGHVLALYRAQMAGHVFSCRVGSIGTEVPLDVVAAVEKRTRCVSIGIINYSPDTDVSLRVGSGARGSLAQRAEGWRINGRSLISINVPGRPENITTDTLEPLDLKEPLLLPAHSITLLKARWQPRR